MTRAEALAAFDQLLLRVIEDHGVPPNKAGELRAAAVNLAHAAATETLAECRRAITETFAEKMP